MASCESIGLPKIERVHRVDLMVEMGLTRSQFTGGKLEVSHLCHEKICINQVHLVLKPHVRNLERLLQAPRYMVSATPPLAFLRCLWMKK